MVVALIALIFAASGTAAAAGGLLKGDKVIKKHSLSGNRLRNKTLTGTQINLSKLGKVPSAKNADHASTANSALTATSATNAVNATNANNASHANNADTVGGQSSGSFLPSSSRIGTNGIVKETGAPSPGNDVTLFTLGPFTVSMNCTKSGSTTTLTINAKSSEANSVAFGSLLATPNTPVDTGPDSSGTSFNENSNNSFDLEAPSGAQGLFDAVSGVNSLGTDCWANFAGIH